MVLTIILGLLGLGIVIFIHELGHFIMAKCVGIEVEQFALGWGPALFTFRGPHTDYRINVLPIGGYCRMKGETEFREAIEKRLDTFPFSEGSMFSVTPTRRLLTYAAGPMSNMVFAILLFSILFLIGYDYTTFPNRIIVADDYPALYGSSDPSPAARGGLVSGDYILSIDSENTENFLDIQQALIDKAEASVLLEYERDGVRGTATLTPELNRQTGAGVIGISPWIEPVVVSIPEGSLLSTSGIREGDRIVKIEDTEVHNVLDIIETIFSIHTKTYFFTVEREGRLLELNTFMDRTDSGEPVFDLIFPSMNVSTREDSILAALLRGTKEVGSTATLALHSLSLLFKGIDLSESMAGPVKLTYIVGEVATSSFSAGILQGITTMLQLLAFISVALGFANLLPIPALDGGQILLSVAEMIKRGEFSPKKYVILQRIGFTIIFTILILTLLNDILFFL